MTWLAFTIGFFAGGLVVTGLYRIKMHLIELYLKDLGGDMATLDRDMATLNKKLDAAGMSMREDA